MGEYIRTTLTFGGKLPRSAVPELIELLDEKGFYDQTVYDGHREGRLTEEMLKDELVADDVNYGDCTDILNHVTSFGVSYRQWMDACSGEDPDVRQRIVMPDGTVVEKHAQAGDGHSPMLTYAELLETVNLIDGFAKLIAEAKWWEQELTLEIVDG